MVKIGIEIHQRLDTTKLFCACQSVIAEDEKPTQIITRSLHPVLSELGEIDEAAKAEFLKKRVFEYQVFEKSNCTVETDEEPPHEINYDALEIALNIAKQLKAKPVDEIHVMRKVVIDGSNTSGFQRTVAVAFNGVIEDSVGNVRISQIALEEESAGIVEIKEDKTVYRLDRLGIPLIEISTEPDIKNGQHLVKIAETIGMMLRATGKVARGIGTIRQDVNVSIEGGARVEIKGAQDLKMLPLLVDNEVKRQQELLKITDELKKKFNGTSRIGFSPVNVSGLFAETSSQFIKSAFSRKENVWALKLSKHAQYLGREIQPNRRYGTELSDYAKTTGVKGIIHSDEDLTKYGISSQEREKIKDVLEMKEEDAFAIVVAFDERAKQALEKVAVRAAMNFIPEETRKANPDGTTSYMRPLPGKARLYPETDIHPIAITAKMLQAMKVSESIWHKRKKLESVLNKEMTEKILRSKNLQLFEKLLERGVDAMLAATTLENTLVALRREGCEVKPEFLFMVFELYKKGRIVKAAIPEMLKELSKGKEPEQAIKENNLEKITGRELEKIVKENNYDIAAIMQRYRLRIDVKDISS